jgi:nucleoside-diphosphate-sugar epimerase
MKKNNILITGSSGFIGAAVLKKLYKNINNNFFLLIREESNLHRINTFLESDRIYTFYEDQLEEIFENKKIDFVIHLATNYIKYDKPSDHHALIKDNVQKPSKIIDLSIQYKIKGFINTGTFFEVSEDENFITEQSLIQPFNFYAKTKIQFQEILEANRKELNAVTLRLFSPYGPNDNQKVIPFIIKSIVQNNYFEIDNPNVNCDFTYVDDIAAAYEKTMNKMIEQNELPCLINVCSGEFVTLEKIIQTLKKISDKKIKFKFKNFETIETKKSSNLLAKDVLEWVPETLIENGLESTYSYYKNLIKNV